MRAHGSEIGAHEEVNIVPHVREHAAVVAAYGAGTDDGDATE